MNTELQALSLLEMVRRQKRFLAWVEKQPAELQKKVRSSCDYIHEVIMEDYLNALDEIPTGELPYTAFKRMDQTLKVAEVFGIAPDRDTAKELVGLIVDIKERTALERVVNRETGDLLYIYQNLRKQLAQFEFDDDPREVLLRLFADASALPCMNDYTGFIALELNCSGCDVSQFILENKEYLTKELLLSPVPKNSLTSKELMEFLRWKIEDTHDEIVVRQVLGRDASRLTSAVWLALKKLDTNVISRIGRLRELIPRRMMIPAHCIENLDMSMRIFESDLDEQSKEMCLKFPLSFLLFSFEKRYSNLIRWIGEKDAWEKQHLKVIFSRAIKERQYSFMRMMDEHADQDILYFSNGFTEVVQNVKQLQLNSVTWKEAQQLAKLSRMVTTYDVLSSYEEILTGHECLQLAKIMEHTPSIQHCRALMDIYAGMRATKVDHRLAVMRELKNVSSDCLRDSDLSVFSKLFSLRKPSEIFLHKDADTICKIILLEREFPQFSISEQTDDIIEFIFENRHAEKLMEFKEVKDALAYLVQVDQKRKRLLEAMEFSSEFYKQYETEILRFMISQDGNIASRYYATEEGVVARNLLRLCKAVIAGKLEKIKYENLDKEIAYEISEDTLRDWKEQYVVNTSYNGIPMTAMECNTFRDVMMIGEWPIRTCMHYKDGAYKECLLSNFDGNKSVVYVKLQDGTIVGRVILRLTKMAYTKSFAQQKVGRTELEFSDVDVDASPQLPEEMLCIFVEKCYIANIDDSKSADVMRIVISLAQEKARRMNVPVLLAKTGYCALEECKTVSLYVYVSRSKNGEQYLDSFNGYHNTASSAQYVSTVCCICNVNT